MYRFVIEDDVENENPVFDKSDLTTVLIDSASTSIASCSFINDFSFKKNNFVDSSECDILIK